LWAEDPPRTREPVDKLIRTASGVVREQSTDGRVWMEQLFIDWALQQLDKIAASVEAKDEVAARREARLLAQRAAA
jgi:hypothetical protein